MVGSFLVNILSGAPLLVALGITFGNTIQTLAGAYLLRRWGGFRGSLDRVRAVLVLIGPVAIVSTMIGATVGVTILLLAGEMFRRDFIDTWRTWWLGHAVGDSIVGSLLLAWWNDRNPVPMPSRRKVEATALAAAVVVATSLLIFTWFPASEAGRFIQACLLIPFLMWGAMAFGMKGATATVFLVSGIAIWGTALGRGPFVQATLSQSLLFLQSFMAITATGMLVLGLVIADRARVYDAERASRLRAEAAEQEAKRLGAIQERLVAVVSHDLRNPLGAIMAGIALLKKWHVNRWEQWEELLLQRQARSAARMEEIIRNVLDVARARTGERFP